MYQHKILSKSVLIRIFFIPLSMSFSASHTVLADHKYPQPIVDYDYRPLAQDFENEDKKLELGRFLFYDKILSGNRNISCATCHHPSASTADALSLPVGEGGKGLAGERDTGAGDHAVHERVPRNSPALFNLGAKEYTVMFHDGRVEDCEEHPAGFCSPADASLPLGLDNALSVQAMFPVTSPAEMAGQEGENAIADLAAAGDLPGLWDRIAGRLRAIPAYCDLFANAYNVSCSEVTFVHAANAIAAFEAKAWRADQSQFDQFLRNKRDALGGVNSDMVRGMRLFYGKAGCSTCHSGKFQTDHGFHAIAMPQLGPGKGDGANTQEDFGRARVTDDINDRFKFRTPSLRNVEFTAPYGHAGSFGTLEAVIRHHLDPVKSLQNYDRSQFTVPSRPDLDDLDFTLFDEPGQPAISDIAAANELNADPMDLTDGEVLELVAFMSALSDWSNSSALTEIPETVPSGLPVED